MIEFCADEAVEFDLWNRRELKISF